MKSVRALGLTVVLLGPGYLAQSGCSPRQTTSTTATTDNTVSRGGTLVATFRSDPVSFNRFVSPHAAEEVIARLTQATLLRVNRVTGALEPRLATSWTPSADQLTWTLRLRDGVQFSDGVPFTAQDVTFTFEALFDKKVDSEIANSLLVDGKPIRARALDDRTVELVFPAPYGPGLTLLDALPILPRHALEAALRSGTFREAWSARGAPADVVGLGPFVLQAFVPSQHLIFARNPHFWGRAADGAALPYLDAIDLQIVPDQNTEVVRFEAGDVDLMTDEVRAEDLAALRRLVADGKAQLVPAGVSISPDWLVFNLRPDARRSSRTWLQREELRQAVSLALDRRAIADTVYLGAAVPIAGPLTPGYGAWYAPSIGRTDRDLARAKSLLASVGLVDRDGDAILDDAAGHPARFTILTQQGHALRQRTTTMIQAQLKEVGLAVDVVALDVPSMIDRWMKGGADALYFYFESDSLDPSRNPDFWLSSGVFHFWNPRQEKPATSWEADIDALMAQVSSSMNDDERHRLFLRVQETFAAHVPMIYAVAPEVTIATSARLQGATPSVLAPQVLWNAEVLSLRPR